MSSTTFGQSSVNDTTITSSARIPIGFVVINGVSVPWEAFSINNVRYASASSYHVTIPTATLPKNLSLNDMVTNAPIVVQIYAGFLKNSSERSSATPDIYPLLIEGYADDISYDARNGLITIVGRDYVSLFMETQVVVNPFSPVQQIDLSMIYSSTSPSSSVIIEIAKAQGLNTQFIQPSSQQIGRILSGQNNPNSNTAALYGLLSSNITQWDLMCYLAKEEQFDLFLIGKNLYFQPRNLNSTPYILTLTIPDYTSSNPLPSSNTVNMVFSRNMRIASNIIVTVNSFNYRTKTMASGVSTLDHTTTISGSDIPATYTYNIPNLTALQAEAKAQKLLLEISQHEMNLNTTIPADQNISLITVFGVVGTNTIFDQNYYIKSMTTDMSFNGSYTMTIEANNQLPYVNQ